MKKVYLIKILSKKETKLKQKPWIFKAILTSIKIKNILCKRYFQKQDIFWYEMEFTPYKAEQPLWGMELQEKEAQND